MRLGSGKRSEDVKPGHAIASTFWFDFLWKLVDRKDRSCPRDCCTVTANDVSRIEFDPVETRPFVSAAISGCRPMKGS